MPTFDAGKSVEALDWNFTTLPNWPKEFSKAKGTIREPSDRMIGDFLDGMKKMYTDAKGLGLEGLDLGENPDPMTVMAALDNVTGDDFVTLMDRVAELFAALVGDSPSKEMILALPLRVRVKFYEWMTDEVVRPEAGSGAGAQVVSLPPHAATG